MWAAADETLGRQVALKLLSHASAAQKNADARADYGVYRADAADDVSEQLRREARALAALTHPHIIVVFDFLETPGVDGAVQPVLVTELLHGRSLAARLAEGRLPWPEALSVCGQLASALAAAHQAGIVHRDVTPGNVMLIDSGVKLLDFGLAEAVTTAEEPSDDGTTVGTPVCMAPEQLMGHGALPASDVYALGCVLHWCLTGRPPYRDKDINWLSQAHLRAEPPPLTIDGLPKGINELYLASLAKEPDERPTAEDAAAMLAPYAPASASSPGAGSGAGAAYTRTYAPLARSASAVASSDRRSWADDTTELLPMIVSGGVATYVGPAAHSGSDTTAGTVTGATAGSPTGAMAGAVGGSATGAIAGMPPSPPSGRHHAAKGRSASGGRSRVFPLAVLLAGLTIIALMTFGLVQTMDGSGTSATRATGAATPSATPAAGSSSAATVGSVILPGGSAAASASGSVSPTTSGAGSATGSRSASAAGAGARPSSGSGAGSPSQVTTSTTALAPLPDPAADPIGYVQALGNQVQALIAQGPGTLLPGAGQNLLNSLGGLQNLLVAAQQHPGNKQWRDVANGIAGLQQRIANDAAAGQISGSAANLLVGELQRLAGSLPSSSSNGNGNGDGNGN